MLFWPLRWILDRTLVPAIDQSSRLTGSNQYLRVSNLVWISSKRFSKLIFERCTAWLRLCQKVKSLRGILLCFLSLGLTRTKWTLWLKSLQKNSCMKSRQILSVLYKHQWRWMDYPGRGKSCRVVANNETQFCCHRIYRLVRSTDCHACGTDWRGKMICSQV
jgi:hypothetical protein